MGTERSERVTDMKNPKEMRAHEINRELRSLAKTQWPKIEKAFAKAGRDIGVATCYLRSADPLDARMIAFRGRWHALMYVVKQECGPGAVEFPKRHKRRPAA